MDTAHGLGISLRRFEGWEPATRYVYDADGRLVASVPESEWDAHQRTLMLARTMWLARQCRQCGGDLVETTAIENDDNYVPLPPVKCHRCTGLMISEKSKEKDPHAAAWLHSVRLRSTTTGR